MSPLVPVQTLYRLSLESLIPVIVRQIGLNSRSTNNIENLRELYQSHLHSDIRNSILDICSRYYYNNIHLVFDIIKILVDKHIQRLNFTIKHDFSCSMCEETGNLFKLLEECEATGLHDFIISVRLWFNEGMGNDIINRINQPLYRLLENGLASSLRRLVLPSICDNKLLKLLGQHAKVLRHLDVMYSWHVDDDGLKALCLRDPSLLTYRCDENVDKQALEQLSSISTSDLNPVCFSLEEIRIQDTNTTELAVALLLLFIPNLKSLGGYIYYRNVGDEIVKLYHHKNGQLSFSLTYLCDSSLDIKKNEVLALAIPKLQHLYTRATCLESLDPLRTITSLTLDFDSRDFTHQLTHFIQKRGHILEWLHINYQEHPMDINILAESCPKLRNISISLCGSTVNKLNHLKQCVVKFSSFSTFQSLLLASPNLEYIMLSESELDSEDSEDDTYDLDDNARSQRLSLILARIIDLHPALDRWHVFAIRMMGKTTLPKEIALSMVRNCPNLTILGYMIYWSRNDEQRLLSYIRDNNLNVQCIFNDGQIPIF